MSSTSSQNAEASSSSRSRRSTLKQRVKRQVDELGEKVEELSVKLKRKDDGHIKLLAPGTPFDEIDLSETTFFHHHDDAPQKTWRSWIFGRKFFFPAGVLIGALLCMWLMKDFSDIPGDLAELWSSIPTNLDPRDLLSNLTLVDDARRALKSRDFSIGDHLRGEYGLEKHHPIILIPGIISTGLESWSTENVARGFFRKRLWGTATMIRAVMTNKQVLERWLQALSIDPDTGLDPPGFKVRAAQGLDAASEFITGYWIWQKIVENLAILGYDSNSMDMAAYDWRLSYYNLEIRDSYFTRLKTKIEIMRRHNKQKVVLCSHSMGGTVVLYFLKWVEMQPDHTGLGGGGGPRWVEENIESWINVAGSILGVSKAMTAFLSGEMRDTVELNPAGSWVLEKFFSRKERAQLFRRWPGASSMWIKGGNRIWGTHDSAPDDPINATDSHGRFLSFRHPGITSDEQNLTHLTVSPNLTMEEASPYILTHTPSNFQRMIETNYSYGFETSEKVLKANDRYHQKWTNPLETRLPAAPSMKIYCLYGHGKETERSYWYMQGEFEQDDSRSDAYEDDAFCDPSGSECNNLTSTRTPLDFPLARRQWIDAAVSVKGSIPEVRSGVKFGDGDGTIPIISLGSMCVKGWKGKTKWNPSGIEVITQEYKHAPETFDLRGGPMTADHVDILGAAPLNTAILQIAAGRGDLVEQTIGSNILDYVERMNWD